MEESEPESVQKSISKNNKKYTIDKTEDEENLVTDNPFINDPSYFSLLECGKTS